MQGFERSPFGLTADPANGALWAGRPDVLSKLVRLVRTLTNRQDSTLDLMWANFGAGKSHALYHTAFLLTQASSRAIIAVVEIPQQLKNFRGLYSRIMSGIDWARVAPIVALAAPGGAAGRDLQRAAHAIANGSSTERDVATEWLVAGRPHLRDLRLYTGITTRIEDDARATDVLAEVVKATAAGGWRLVLLLDEFQRLGDARSANNGILSCVRSLFSRNPVGLSIVAAATTRQQAAALILLTPELQTLIGGKPSLGLPEMTEHEAFEFVLDRFKWFRSDNYAGGPTDPLGEAAIRAAIRFVAENPTVRVTPRTVLEALAWVYDGLSPDVEGIGAAETKALLSELSWGSEGNGDQT